MILRAADVAPVAGQCTLPSRRALGQSLFRAGRALLVDWNWTSFADPDLDVAAWLPSVTVEGGPAPWQVLPGRGRAGGVRRRRRGGRGRAACTRDGTNREARATRPTGGRARLDRSRARAAALAQPVGERLERARLEADLAALDRSLRPRAPVQVPRRSWSGLQHRRLPLAITDDPLAKLDVDGGQQPLVVDVRVLSGTGTQMVTEPPFGRAACSITGAARSDTSPTVTTSDSPGILHVVTERSPGAERVVDLRPRTTLSVIGVVLAVAATLEVLFIARHVITWILIASSSRSRSTRRRWIGRHGPLGRGAAIGVTYVVLIVIAGSARSCPDPRQPGERPREQGAGLRRRPDERPRATRVPRDEVPLVEKAREAVTTAGRRSSLASPAPRCRSRRA